MMDKATWINLVIGGLKMFGNPTEEFLQYESQTMVKFYNNYLEYACVFLYETADFDRFVEEYAGSFFLPTSLVGKLHSAKKEIDNFYEACKGLDDFVLLRRQEWDAIIPLAQECLEGLQKMEAESKTISGASS